MTPDFAATLEALGFAPAADIGITVTEEAPTRAERIAAHIASLPECRYCFGSGFKSWYDETGTPHRTAERNAGKCDVCHGHGRSCHI